MADRAPATFLGVCENAFYFEGPQCSTEDDLDGCVEGDLFQASNTNKTPTRFLRSHDNKYLTISCSGVFEKQFLTEHEQSSLEGKFCPCFFNNISTNATQGIPVMLYAVKSGKKWVACCNGSGEIYPEEMEIQAYITESKHKALFYMIGPEPSNAYMFESSLYKNKFLGFDSDVPTPAVKLILRTYDPDNHNDKFSLE